MISDDDIFVIDPNYIVKRIYHEKIIITNHEIRTFSLVYLMLEHLKRKKITVRWICTISWIIEIRHVTLSIQKKVYVLCYINLLQDNN